MRNNFLFTVDILNNEYWVAVFVGDDIEKLTKLVKRHFETNEIPKTNNPRGFYFGHTDYSPFIWINTKLFNKKSDTIYATVAHEAIHAIDDIFRKIGSQERDELFAHGVTAIVRKFHLEYIKK